MLLSISQNGSICDFQPLVLRAFFERWTNDEHNITWPISAKRLGLQREPFWVFHDDSAVVRTLSAGRRNRTRATKKGYVATGFLLVHLVCFGWLILIVFVFYFEAFKWRLNKVCIPWCGLMDVERCFSLQFLGGTAPEANSYQKLQLTLVCDWQTPYPGALINMPNNKIWPMTKYHHIWLMIT